MSYDIYIGDAREGSDDPDSDDYSYGCAWYVPRIDLPDAPQFPGDEMTGQSNGRHPSYRQWAEFCRAVGLEDLFFHQCHGLMRHHPGCEFLHPPHLEAVQMALKHYQDRHPGAIPGFVEPFHDSLLPRLLWLEWWMRRTLETAEVPAIFNY